jgi:hypothetical protein
MEQIQSLDNSIIKKRPTTKIPVNECSPERIKVWYHEQVDWYQWAIEYSLSEAEKVRTELEQLRVKVIDLPNLKPHIECKELELAELESDARSFGDILETYRELAGDNEPNPTHQQEDCFD